jgi:hypothetical protein
VELRKASTTTPLDRLHDYLDAAATLVTGGATTWEEAHVRTDLSTDQRAALRVMLHAATSSFHASPANVEKIRTLAAAVGTYADHRDKDLAYWRAATLVEAALGLLGGLPPAVKGTGVATWLVRELAAEVDAPLSAWLDRRDALLDMLRKHTKRRAKGKLTTAAIVAKLVRGANALGHRDDAKGSTFEHTTKAVGNAVERYTKR